MVEIDLLDGHILGYTYRTPNSPDFGVRSEAADPGGPVRSGLVKKGQLIYAKTTKKRPKPRFLSPIPAYQFIQKRSPGPISPPYIW